MVHWNSAEVIGAVIGGSLIAFSAMINLFLLGRVTGLSGIFFSIFKLDVKNGLVWKLAFVAGLFLVPFIMARTENTSVELNGEIWPFYDSRAEFAEDINYYGFAIAGFLVGLGTKMGNGCTSGHGVCGLSRLSKRSLVAVCTFMSTAFLMANFRYYVPFLNNERTASQEFHDGYDIFGDVVFGTASAAGIGAIIYAAKTAQAGLPKVEPLIAFFTGTLFGAGLLLSGMLRRSKIAGFLTFNNEWDPTLAFVLGSSVFWNTIATQYILRSKKETAFGTKLHVPTNKTIDPFLVAGAALFGLGWGFAALCPGPAFIDFLSFYQIIIWLPFCVLGMFLADPIKEAIIRSQVKKIDSVDSSTEKPNHNVIVKEVTRVPSNRSEDETVIEKV